MNDNFDLTKEGSSIIRVRIPRTMIEALDLMALELGTTPPKLIRHLIYVELQRRINNYNGADNPDQGA